MLWHELTWQQVAAADKNLPVVVPLGSLEQHGPHLPLLVDAIQVDEIARRVERQLADQMLLLPTLWLGSSHHHRDFPGTVSLRPLLYAEVIQDVARSVLRAGFRRVLFLNGHGGNRIPVADALSDLVAVDDAADDAYLVVSSWWELAGPAIANCSADLQQSSILHACEYETSLILALRPDLADLSKLAPAADALQTAWCDTENPGGGRVSLIRRFHRFTAHGPLGRPQCASAEKGRRIVEAATAEIVAFLRDFARWPELRILGPTPVRSSTPDAPTPESPLP